MKKPKGLTGSRLYRGLDDRTVVLVSEFESIKAQEEIFQSPAFKENLSKLQVFVESSSPAIYEEATRTTASISPAMPALRLASRHGGDRRTAMQITLIDTFIVSEESKPALLEASRTIQGISRRCPDSSRGSSTRSAAAAGRTTS